MFSSNIPAGTRRKTTETSGQFWPPEAGDSVGAETTGREETERHRQTSGTSKTNITATATWIIHEVQTILKSPPHRVNTVHC